MSALAFVAGVAIALCTTLMSAGGLVLQKRAHAARAQPLAHSCCCCRGCSPARATWLGGIILMTVSALLSLSVFALVGQTVASSFASLTVLWNLLLSRLVLHEKVRAFDLGVALLMVAGTVLVVIFGGGLRAQSRFVSPAETLALMSRPTAVASLGAFLCAALLCAACNAAADRAPGRGLFYRSSVVTRCLAAGLCSAFVGAAAKGLTGAFATGAGGTGAPWGFLCVLLPALVLQLAFLNSALARFRAVVCVPIYQGLLVICGVISGALLWGESDGRSAAETGGFCCGVLLILLGVALLLFPHAHPQERQMQGGARGRAWSEPLPRGTALTRHASSMGLHAVVLRCGNGALRTRGVKLALDVTTGAASYRALEAALLEPRAAAPAVHVLLPSTRHRTTSAPPGTRALQAAVQLAQLLTPCLGAMPPVVRLEKADDGSAPDTAEERARLLSLSALFIAAPLLCLSLPRAHARHIAATDAAAQLRRYKTTHIPLSTAAQVLAHAQARPLRRAHSALSHTQPAVLLPRHMRTASAPAIHRLRLAQALEARPLRCPLAEYRALAGGVDAVLLASAVRAAARVRQGNVAVAVARVEGRPVL